MKSNKNSDNSVQNKNQTKQKRKKGRKRHKNKNMSRTPAGFGMSLTPIHRITGSGPVVQLHVREIFPVSPAEVSLAMILPICPSKWTGTRTSVLSSPYTQHRPLSLRVTWSPICGTAETGVFCFGTVFDGARAMLPQGQVVDTLPLASTNGGFVTTIWKPWSSSVSLGKNLRANGFPLYDVSDDDIPFWLVYTCSKQGYVGNLIIDAVFTLRNPIPVPQQPVASSNSFVALTPNVEAKTTSFTLGSFSGNFVPGQQYSFAFASDLISAAQVMVPSLRAVDATVTNASPPTFSLPFAIDAAKTVFASLIGASQDF